MFLALAFVSALVFASIPRLVSRAYGVPATFAQHVRWSLFAATGFLTIVAVSQREYGDRFAAGVGAFVFVLITFVTIARTRRHVVLDRLATSLAAKESAAKAIASIDELLASWWQGKGTSRNGRPQDPVRWTLHYASAALNAGHPESALRWLGVIPSASMPVGMRAVAAQYRASAHLRLGDSAAARAALAEAPRPAPAGFEEALVAVEALVDAIEAKPDVLERIDAALPAAEGAVRETWLIAKAHALATAGNDEGSTDILRDLRTTKGASGPSTLERIVRHKGPASPAADRLLASDGPYR